jgi:predicted ATPase
MARLDRLDTVKSLAQLGATLGREFSAALLQAVAPWDARTVQRGLHQLVAAELLYQRERPPQTTYVFKHALIQEAAYQSLLRSTRQQYHQRIAQVVESQFPEIVATQPALVAHHYTEAGLAEPAITYWQHAGQQALQRSANLEAVQHLRKGIEVLQTLPDTPARTPHELTLLLALGRALVPTQGFAAPDVEHVYGRARALCQQVGEAPQLFSVVFGLRTLAEVRGDLTTSQTLGAQLLAMAQGTHDPVCLLGAHQAVGITSFLRGEVVAARTHLEQGLALYSPSQHRTYVSLYGEQDPGVSCRCFAAWARWVLGAADQALEQIHAAQRLAQELGHPYAQVWALLMAVVVTQLRGEGAHAIAAAEAAVALATAQGFALLEVWATMFRGWALADQGRREEGMAHLRQGLSVTRAVGVECLRPWWLILLAEVAGQAGPPEVGLALLIEAHDVMDTTGERFWAAERQRLQGVLVLQQTVPDAPLAETCFQQALVVARRQQAKALELRAAMSLARLWQQQGKRSAAHALLAPIYGWFTEGFDTSDLQEAKALLEALA